MIVSAATMSESLDRRQIRHRPRREQPAARLGDPARPAERLTRALSVAMPVFAYICR